MAQRWTVNVMVVGTILWGISQSVNRAELEFLSFRLFVWT